MLTNNGIRNVLGIIGNVISFGLFLSPVKTFWGIIKKKSVEEFKPDPYVVTILNCAMWILYGLPYVHPNNILVATINGIGLGIECIYVIIFLIYSTNEQRKNICTALIIEIAFFVVMFIESILAMHTTKDRTKFVGILCVVFNVAMYFSPLTVMFKVIKTKSVKYMPFFLTLTNFLNGAIWTCYACIGTIDYWMVVPNGLGTLSGIIQLILYGCYHDWKSTNKSDYKTEQIELPTQTV